MDELLARRQETAVIMLSSTGYPEDFFVTFSHAEDRDLVLTSPRLDYPSGRSYHLRAWDDRREGHHIFYRYRAKLCFEGIPMHARTDAAAEKLLVQNVPCTTLKSTQGGGTTTVLSNDPRSILKMAWFGLPNPDMEPIPRDMPLPEFNPMHNPPPDDDVTQGCGDDPMEVQVAINYSPEGDGSRKACPEYTPLATGLDAVQETSIDMVDQLVNSLSTPVRPPILPTPRPIRTKRPKIAIQSSQRHSEGLESKRRNNCKLEMVGQEIISKRFGTTNEGDTFNGNVKKLYLQRFKRPLTPRSLKMIADLVEKGASGRPKQRPSSSRRHPSPRPEDDRCCLGGRLHK
ncbi:hypothetical protein OsI_08127 [Oryza sativa Indica Group]|uniref:Uncharacterized protein n=1 Tax=Oryza sativa subsp. indica TaxID=39946 RepID=B8AFP5_ORYSI|nr:hypothetical protein OsI_08127 [Oryza sativa Indica Group]